MWVCLVYENKWYAYTLTGKTVSELRKKVLEDQIKFKNYKKQYKEKLGIKKSYHFGILTSSVTI